jgi:hypothetical protein
MSTSGEIKEVLLHAVLEGGSNIKANEVTHLADAIYGALKTNKMIDPSKKKKGKKKSR